MKIKPLKDILPENPVLLMGAGPVPIPEEVKNANGVVISHLGADMAVVTKEIRKMSSYVFQTKSDKILGIAGPASAAMEMAISSVVRKDSKVLVLRMGMFSGRFGEMASKLGADVDYIDGNGKIILPKQVEELLSNKDYDVITMVQGETSCGVHNIFVEEISKIAKSKDLVIIVDAVCTLSTIPMKMDDWGIDIVVTGGQKGLSSIPGVSLIAFSEDIWERITENKMKVPHWCLDVNKAKEFWINNKYHYTAPVPGVLALYEALRLICEETLENRHIRHRQGSEFLQKGISIMGLEMYTPEEHRLFSVVAISPPVGIKTKDIIDNMLEDFNIEIAGSFGLDIFRIGQMGEQCRKENITKVLIALAKTLKKLNYDFDIKNIEEFLENNKNLKL